MASASSTSIDDRYQWGECGQDRVDGLDLLDDPPPRSTRNEPELAELDQIRAMTIPVEFWSPSTRPPSIPP